MRSILRRGLPLILATLATALPGLVAAAQLAPTPRAQLVAVSESNRPFLAAARAEQPLDLARSGYLEEEYLLSGLANIYEWGATPADPVVVRNAGVPYATRMLLRRPADAKRFSGRVIVELLNPTALHDIAPLWGLSHAHFTRRGDIWVGLTVKPVAIAALQRFDPVRYGALGFAFAQADGCSVEPVDAENGLAWDVIAQAGALLRSSSKENPLLLFEPRQLIAAGYSQTGGYVVTYANALHSQMRLGGGAAVYDGYLNGAGRQGNIPINQCATPLPEGDPRRAVMPRSVPFVTVMTQSDFSTQPALRREDSDEPGDEYRLYEVAGSGHAAPAPAGMPAPSDLEIAGLAPFDESRCVEDRNDFPLGLAFNAVWEQFHQRLASGTPMSSEPRMQLDAQGQPATDATGNALGGWRLPQIDLPLAVYRGAATPRTDDEATRSVCRLMGARQALEPAQLKDLYRDRNAYLRQFNEAIDAAVAARRLVAEDAAELRSAAPRSVPAF